MNIQENMEAILVGVLAALGVGGFMLDHVSEAQAKPQTPIARNVATPTSMALVIIRAPRPRTGN